MGLLCACVLVRVYVLFVFVAVRFGLVLICSFVCGSVVFILRLMFASWFELWFLGLIWVVCGLNAWFVWMLFLFCHFVVLFRCFVVFGVLLGVTSWRLVVFRDFVFC